MADKLDGSFSGLWTCELCGKTGTDCTCEHFSRDFPTWGKRKTFSDAELSAELWHAIVLFNGSVRLHSVFDDEISKIIYKRDRDRMFTIQAFVDGTDRHILEG
ncbi:hypothetical protein SEA_ATUIN_279 [Arthrobacter phage Atuin]|nr:hypothetical protein SEA_ATUIN_78 [Arthrobacter phage Atuin]